jgi:STE24 endopeptidase
MEYNGYFWFSLIAVVALYLVEQVARWLNLTSLQSDLPQEFADVYNSDEYRKSQDYTRETSRFELFSDTFALLLFLVFWLARGFGWLDEFARSFGYGEVISGLLFIGLLSLAQYVIELPFSIYDTFVIEERYGFNKTTVGTFIADQIKSLALTVLLGVPILVALMWIFENIRYAWLYAWVLTAAFSMLLTYLAPTFILPLFNKFSPLEEGELRSEISQLAERCDFPLGEVSVMDGSRRSSKSNAFFIGFGKTKRIALYDTLIANHTIRELVAVLAHEIGHYKKRHVLQVIVAAIAQMGVFFFVIGLFLKNEGLSRAFGVAQPSVYCSLVFFSILYKPISFTLSIAMNCLSRRNEYQADAFASEKSGGPAEIVSALKKLSKDNLSNLTPHPLYVFLFYSHPTVLQRIDRLRTADRALTSSAVGPVPS